MKSVALLLFAVVFLLDSEAAQAQWSKGGSGGGGWGGSAGGGQWGGPTGQPSQPRQPPPTPRQPPASLQQPGWTSPPAKPQPPVHVIPGRPGPNHMPQRPRPVVPPGSGGWWGAPFPPSAPPHWRRDRFFRHRPGGLGEQRTYGPRPRRRCTPIRAIRADTGFPIPLIYVIA